MRIKTGHGSISLQKLLAIYSISMVTSLPGLAISPILGKLETIFRHATELQLQLLETLPSFIIVPFILIAGRLSLRTNKKKLLITGLSVFFACSVIYFFANKMWLLLLNSALLGIGAGLVIPFSTGLVADYFSGVYRTKHLGYVSAINNFTLVLATLLAGFLAGINWHLSFLVYCIAGISLCFVFFLDNKPVSAVPVQTAPQRVGFKWPILLMLLYFFITLLALTVPLNLALYIHNLHLGAYDTSGTLIAIFFLAITLPGLFVEKILGRLKAYTNFCAMVLISIGLILFVFKSGLLLLTVGVLSIGFGYGVMQPIIYNKTANMVSTTDATYALALVMVMNYIAILTYPFFLELLQKIFHGDSAYFPFTISGILAVAFTIYSYFRRYSPTLG